MTSQNPPSKHLQEIVNLYTQGRFKKALLESNKMLERFPNSVILFNISGASNSGLRQFDAAIKCYKKAVKIKPDYYEAHYNLGVAFQDKNNFIEAIDSYEKVLQIRPEHFVAYNNIGIAKQNLGYIKAAIDSYEKAIKLNPEYPDAYNNIANAQQELGDLDSALDNYSKAIKINPDYAEAKSNIIKLLTKYSPAKKNLNELVEVNEKIRKINILNGNSKIISDDQVVKLFTKSENLISLLKIDVKNQETQTYRKNLVDLNCKRHMSVFEKNNIIPEFCFGCYKVEVEPRSIIELIKLFIIFDQLKLNENNTRKCMIELRPEISGFYKGLIYCSSLKQANKISKYLDQIINQSLSGLSSTVKRGCSEYPISFPNYKEINNFGPQLMNYNKDWKVFEVAHDKINPKRANKYRKQSISGFNLNDIIIIRKWIDYAKGIGDPSVNLLNQRTIHYHEIYEKAKSRLHKFNFNKITNNL